MDTETISVTLPAEIVRAIRDAVETGAYSSADAVVEDALRLLQEDETETPEFAAYMRGRDQGVAPGSAAERADQGSVRATEAQA